MIRWLLLALALVASACGYSEAEMQLQRDKSTALTGAVERIIADHAACRVQLDTLERELVELRAKSFGGTP